MIQMLFFNVIYLVLAFMVGKKITSLKVKPKKAVTLLGLLWVCISCGNYFGPTHFSSCFIFFSLILLFRFLFQLSWSISILSGGFFIILVAISEFISMWLMTIVSNIDQVKRINSRDNSCLFVTTVFVLCFLIYIFIPFLKRLVSKPIPKYSWILAFIPFSTLLLFLSVEDYFQMVESNAKVFFVFVVFVAADFIMLFLYVRTISAIDTEKELFIREEREQHLRNQVKFLDQQYKLNSTFVHDLLQQESRIANLIENGNKDEAIHILESLSQTTYREFNGILSESNVFNVLITQFQSQIREKGLQLKTTIAIDDFEFMSLSEQYEFFHRLLNIIFERVENRMDKDDCVIVITCKRNKLFRKIVCLIPLSLQSFEYQFDDSVSMKYSLNVHYRQIMEFKKEEIEFSLMNNSQEHSL